MNGLGLENFKRRFDEQLVFEPTLFAPRYYGENLEYGVEGVNWGNIAKVAGGLSIIGVILAIIKKFFGKESEGKSYSSAAVTKAAETNANAPTPEETSKTLNDTATKLDHAHLTPEQLDKAKKLAEHIATEGAKVGADVPNVNISEIKDAKSLAKTVSIMGKAFTQVNPDNVKSSLKSGFIYHTNPVKAVAETMATVEAVEHELANIEKEIPKVVEAIKKTKQKIKTSKNQRRTQPGDGDKYANKNNTPSTESYLEFGFEDFGGDDFLNFIQGACSEINLDAIDNALSTRADIDNALQNLNPNPEIPTDNQPFPSSLQTRLNEALADSHLWESVNNGYEKVKKVKEMIGEKIAPLLEMVDKAVSELSEPDVMSEMRDEALEEYLQHYAITLTELDESDDHRHRAAKYISDKVQKCKNIMLQEIQQKRLMPLLKYAHKALNLITKADHVYHAAIDGLMQHSENIHKLSECVTKLADLAI